MTVREVIAMLSVHPPDARVLVEGYEFGWCDLSKICSARVALDANTQGWAGPHKAIGDLDTSEALCEEDARGRGLEVVEVVLLQPLEK